MAGEPVALLPGGELDVGPGPADGPVVLALERSNCALPCQSFQASSKESFTPEPALLGAVDEEHAAEGPVRLTAQVGGVLLVDDGHLLAAASQFVGGNQARQAGADHDDISIHRAILSIESTMNTLTYPMYYQYPM